MTSKRTQFRTLLLPFNYSIVLIAQNLVLAIVANSKRFLSVFVWHDYQRPLSHSFQFGYRKFKLTVVEFRKAMIGYIWSIYMQVQQRNNQSTTTTMWHAHIFKNKTKDSYQ